MQEVIGAIAALLLLVGLTMLNSLRARGRRRDRLDEHTRRHFEQRRLDNTAAFDRDRQC